MNWDNIFTTETTVKITVVKLDNKKLTKGIFNQLKISSPFDKLYELQDEAKILGYVNDKERWIIWSDGNNLYKCLLNYLRSFINFNTDRIEIYGLSEVYPSENVKLLEQKSHENEEGYYTLDDSQELDKEVKSEIINKQKMLVAFGKEIVNRQIFL